MTIPTTNIKVTASYIELEKIPDLKFYVNHRNHWISYVAIAYVLVGYGLSLFCITTNIWWLNLLGVLLLIHNLTWAALFLHEFFHHNIFSSHRLNVVFGEIMLFLTGSCYSVFSNVARHHIAHHVRRADFSPFHPFSMSDFLQSLPKPVQRLVVLLEWLCIPAVNLLFRWMIALSPFLGQNRRDERLRNALLLLLRGSLFTALAIYSPRGIICYFIAYISFLNIIQFLECFQHTYSVFHIDGKVPKHSQKYDENNTYSLVLSPRWSWLSSLIFLNNNYHNAHHRLMSCPWYLLPRLDDELYSRSYQQYIGVSKLLKNYFRYRIHRLFQGQGTVDKTEKGLDIEKFAGATGMSFMLQRKPFDWLKLSSSVSSNN
ncbi:MULTISPECIES: fatty acid desaturase [unclassified Moorena]|uniref:fatty acid desaturase n=1 Tax=unclassified Moorena TaxID=2683338 RepID=UPI0013C62E45|nr:MULTISPECIES: fatty acid desaturase [unclassified Moorena]NEP37290.1 fatty acid desaturase [Moorena sp. SIO3B2]NES44784.1 fatty acid desaturase [Moorena sp. SIO2C4]